MASRVRDTLRFQGEDFALLVLDRRTDGRGKPKPRRNKQTGPVRESEANMDLLFRSLRKEKKINSC
jgi:hypothetical protein